MTGPPDFTTDVAHHLRAGTGRAVLHLRGHDWRPLAGAIEDACLRYPGYDAQCEGDRAGWVVDRVRQIGQVEQFGEIVAAALPERLPEAEHWDWGHRLDVAGHLAAAGSKAARSAVRAAFDADPAETFHGGGAMVRAFGADGLVEVARRVGRAIAGGQDVWPGSVLSDSEGTFEESDARAILARAAEADGDVRFLLKAIEDDDAARERRRREPATPGPAETMSVAEWVDALTDPTGRSGMSARRWMREATGADLSGVAQVLARATDDRTRALIARAFAHRPFPGDPAPLLAMLDLIDSVYAWTDRAQAHAAAHALGNVNRPEVRADSLRRLESGGAVDRALDMLAASFHPGDERAIEAAIAPVTDEHDVHAVGSALLKVFDAHPGPACLASMRFIYERGRCSLCRGGAVKKMVTADVLPARYADECPFDCESTVRDAPAGFET